MKILGLLALVVASNTAFAQAPAPPAGTPIIGARLGLAMLGQEGHAPGLCCGERDSWRTVGPAAALRGGYLIGSRFLLGAEASYSYHHRETATDEIRVHAPALSADASFVVHAGTPRIVAGVGGGLLRFSGDTSEMSAGGPPFLGTIDEWHPELHARFAFEVPIGSGLAAGAELTLTKVMIAQHFVSATATVSYWPGGD